MHIPFSRAKKIETQEGNIWDYEINKEIGVSYQTLHMRGPQSGRYVNTVCHEVYFIIKGEAVFVVGEYKYSVSENDVIVVEPNTPHHIETEDLTYVTITRPDWFEGQAKLVE